MAGAVKSKIARTLNQQVWLTKMLQRQALSFTHIYSYSAIQIYLNSMKNLQSLTDSHSIQLSWVLFHWSGYRTRDIIYANELKDGGSMRIRLSSLDCGIISHVTNVPDKCNAANFWVEVWTSMHSPLTKILTSDWALCNV